MVIPGFGWTNNGPAGPRNLKHSRPSLGQAKETREFLETCRGNPSAINRHKEIKDVYTPFKGDDQKAKKETVRPKQLLPSNQHQIRLEVNTIGIVPIFEG